MNILQVKVSRSSIPRHVRGINRRGNGHGKSPISTNSSTSSSDYSSSYTYHQKEKDTQGNNLLTWNPNTIFYNGIAPQDFFHVPCSPAGGSNHGSSPFLRLSARAIHTTSSVASDDHIDTNANANADTHTIEEGKKKNDFEYNPSQAKKDITEASKWHEDPRKWDVQFCRRAVEAYKSHLQYLLEIKQNQLNTGSKSEREKSEQILRDGADLLLKSHITSLALSAMLKMKIPTHVLSKEVRSMERLIGSIGLTPLTDQLSLNLLRANGKAGNIGRVISLLNLRKAKGSEPKRSEFEHAIQSIDSAALYLRKNRNIFLNEGEQPEIDNPTRWLDAILVNMSERGFPLDTKMANRMLDCYSCQGRDGKAVHFFYRVTREFVNEDKDNNEESSKDNESGIDSDSDSDDDKDTNDKDLEKGKQDLMPIINDRKAKVRMKLVRQMPPYYKMPSGNKSTGTMVKVPNKSDVKSKLEWEKERDFSISLTAAFAFADSLTHGACGHNPIQLDLASWNTLIKACVYRGAIMRALDILNETMPKNGIEPDAFSYNSILSGLARLGDKDFMREILLIMTNKSIPANKYTVQALVDGYLNSGDISGAVTLVQDFFNQHRILPPYTTHIKIIEFALGNDLIYEAKRQVYFIQQLQKWKPKEGDPPSLRKFMYLTQRNPKLSERSLKRLFAYFGEELTDRDFF